MLWSAILLAPPAWSTPPIGAENSQEERQLVEEFQIAMELELTGGVARKFIGYLDFGEWERRHPQEASRILRQVRTRRRPSHDPIESLAQLSLDERWVLVRSFYHRRGSDGATELTPSLIPVEGLQLRTDLPGPLIQALAPIRWQEDLPGVIELRHSSPMYDQGLAVFHTRLETIARELGVWENWLLNPSFTRRALRGRPNLETFREGGAHLQLNISHPQRDLTLATHLWNLSRIRVGRTQGLNLHSGLVALAPIDQKGLIRLRSPHWAELRAILFSPRIEIFSFAHTLLHPNSYAQGIREEIASGQFLSNIDRQVRAGRTQDPETNLYMTLRNLSGLVSGLDAIHPLCPSCGLHAEGYQDLLRGWIRGRTIHTQSQGSLLIESLVHGRNVLPLAVLNDLHLLASPLLAGDLIEGEQKLRLVDALLASPALQPRDFHAILLAILESRGAPTYSRSERREVLHTLRRRLLELANPTPFLEPILRSPSARVREASLILEREVARHRAPPAQGEAECSTSLQQSLTRLRQE